MLCMAFEFWNLLNYSLWKQSCCQTFYNKLQGWWAQPRGFLAVYQWFPRSDKMSPLALKIAFCFTWFLEAMSYRHSCSCHMVISSSCFSSVQTSIVFQEGNPMTRTVTWPDCDSLIDDLHHRVVHTDTKGQTSSNYDQQDYEYKKTKKNMLNLPNSSRTDRSGLWSCDYSHCAAPHFIRLLIHGRVALALEAQKCRALHYNLSCDSDTWRTGGQTGHVRVVVSNDLLAHYWFSQTSF